MKLGNVAVDVAGSADDFVQGACSIPLDAEICRVMVAILIFHFGSVRSASAIGKSIYHACILEVKARGGLSWIIFHLDGCR